MVVVAGGVLERNHAAHENVGLIYYALTLQQIRNIANTEAARDVDHLVLGERAGRFEPLLADEQSGAYRNGDHHEQREYRISNHDDRMACPP